MYYGLTIENIVSAFNGATVSDFATNNQSGEEIILEEIKMAFDESKNLLEVNIANMIESEVPAFIISTTCEDASGNFTYQLPGIPGDSCIVLKDFSQTLIVDGTIYYGNCSTRCGDVNISSFPDFQDYTISESGLITFGPSYNGENILVTGLRGEGLFIPEMKRYLRNSVACIVGRQLYSTSGDEWTLISDGYCKSSHDFQKKYEHKKFAPSAIKSLRWLNSPFSFGIFSVKIRRI